MADRLITLAAGPPARVDLKAYEAELPLGSLVVGVDNIHHDVYLSTPFCEQTRTYLLELIRQTANITYAVHKDSRPPKGPETGAWKKQLFSKLRFRYLSDQWSSGGSNMEPTRFRALNLC